MNIKRWYFKENFEEYNCLYEDESFILVQNIENKEYSFGITADFGSFYGFPVNQSCLNADECIERLRQFIKINEKYGDINNTTEIYNKMIEAVQESKENEMLQSNAQETEEEEEDCL